MSTKKITTEMILDAAPVTDRSRVGECVKYLNEWAERFDVTSDLRMAHLLGQLWHESGCLRHVEENLNYSAQGLMKTWPGRFRTVTEAQRYARKPQAIANRVYANRMGNGPESSGDGWRFRGRGLIQLTGRENYQAYADSEHCKGDLMKHPEWLAQFPGAVKSAMWFWQEHGLNELADRDDVRAVTRRINGGLNGLSEREYITMRMKRMLGV